MAAVIEYETANVYRLEIHGTLHKADLDRCEERLASEMDRVGPVRLLVVLVDFEGWEPRPDWNDLGFYAKRGGVIERIAIIGTPRWRSEALMFAGADLRSAPVAFFPVGAADDARAGLFA